MQNNEPRSGVDGSATKLAGDALNRAVRRGTGIATTAHIAAQLLGLAVLAALYRLIEPEQFGLLAMILPLLALVQIFMMPGLNIVTVQRETISDAQVSWLFWVNLALCAALAVLVAALGPLLAWFYQRSELTSLTAAVAGTIVVTGLGAQHQALLERHLRLKPLATARLAAQLVGGLAAVLAAVAGWGVWALILQLYVAAVVLGGMLWQFEPWRPSRPKRQQDVAQLVRFGGFFTASSLMFYLAQNVDKVLIGWAAGAAVLGLYSQAFNLMMKPVYLLMTPLAGVMLPGLSRAAADREAFGRLLLAFTRIIALAMMPAGVGLFIVAPELILALGGPSWMAAGPLLRALSVAILAQGFVNMAGSVYTASGLTGRLLVAASALAACITAGLGMGWFVGQHYERPAMGVACGYSLTILVIAGPYLAYCLQAAGVGFGDWLRQLRRPVLAAIGMGIVLLAARATAEQTVRLPAVAWLITQLVLGAASYGLLARGQIRWVVGQFRLLHKGEKPV